MIRKIKNIFNNSFKNLEFKNIIVNVIDLIRSLFVSDLFLVFIFISPIILTFFYFNGHYIPSSFLSVYIANLFCILSLIYIVFFHKKIQNLSFYFFLSAVIFSIISHLFGFLGGSYFFDGGMFEGWSFFNIVSLSFLVAVIFNLQLNKKAIFITALPLIYSIVVFSLAVYYPGLNSFVYKINTPVLYYGTLNNYIFVYSLIIFISSLLSYYIYGKVSFIRDLNIKSGNRKYLAFLVLFLSVLYFIFITLKLFSVYLYSKANISISLGNIFESKNYINKAIYLYGYDAYYIYRAQISGQEISMLSTKEMTNSQKMYIKQLFDYQISDVEHAISLNKIKASNYIYLANVYENMYSILGDDVISKALESYDKALDLASDKDNVYALKAKLNFALGKEEEGINLLNSALDFNVLSTMALNMYGDYYLSKNEYEKSVEYYDKSIQSFDKDSKVWFNLGSVYLKMKKYNEAEQSFINSFLLSGGGDSVSLYNIGLIYKEKGEQEKLKMIIDELEKRYGTEIKEIQELKSNNIKDDKKND